MADKDAYIDWSLVRSDLLKQEKIKAALITAVDGYLEKSKSLILTHTVSVEKNIMVIGPSSIEIEGGIKFNSKYLASHMKGAKLMRAFLVTLGNPLEDTASHLMKEGDGLGGYMLDRIGSIATEYLAENFENRLRETYAAKGLSVSMRFSPGYCDWPVEEQFKLADILDFSRIGVRLTEACMMTPKKSISAIVGIGPKALFSKVKSPCVLCDKKKDCDYRRV